MTATNGTAKFSNLAQGLAALVGASAVVAGGMYGLAVAPLQNRVPAFAQSTPKNGVQVGDIIYRGPKADPAWVVEKVDKPNGDISFKLLKANGEKRSAAGYIQDHFSY